MKEKWENFKASLSDITAMSRREFLLTVAVCILGGMVFGMLFSPRKSTVIGSNNGNNSGNGNSGNGCCGGQELEEGEEA
ncbi:MAG: hypothetical protein K2O16_16645 [Lachnospiraceae bacterium]|nr:hypothetical protein [Lachnospiraceae bacterium]